MLIVQNIMVTLELALLILLAFILRKRRRLHGAFLLGTAIQFMGIALVFTLVSFVPPFKIEGPDTFYRFGMAGAASQFVCLAAGLFFFIRDPRHGWPVFLAGLLLAFNTGLDWFLGKQHLLEPLTAFVGSINQTLSFTGSFAVLVAALAATGIETWPAAKYRKGLAGS